MGLLREHGRRCLPLVLDLVLPLRLGELLRGSLLRRVVLAILLLERDALLPGEPPVPPSASTVACCCVVRPLSFSARRGGAVVPLLVACRRWRDRVLRVPAALWRLPVLPELPALAHWLGAPGTPVGGGTTAPAT